MVVLLVRSNDLLSFLYVRSNDLLSFLYVRSNDLLSYSLFVISRILTTASLTLHSINDQILTPADHLPSRSPVTTLVE
jgi:hypothetical protein